MAQAVQDDQFNMQNQIAELHTEVFENDIKSLWVFAYGSLCWKPGFEFRKAVIGHVQGFHRRFWQGNSTHRGTEEKPGRVATLVEDQKGTVHGVAFAITGEAALPYLSHRECDLGGYITQFTTFYPSNGQPFKVLLYLATPKNPLWLGESKEDEIAKQIVDCKGPSGHNVEYIIRLANFMRQHFPEHHDEHLYELEKEVLNVIREKNLCLVSMMGTGEGCVNFVKISASTSGQRRENEQERIESFQHTTRVPEKTLRCLNI